MTGEWDFVAVLRLREHERAGAGRDRQHLAAQRRAQDLTRWSRSRSTHNTTSRRCSPSVSERLSAAPCAVRATRSARSNARPSRHRCRRRRPASRPLPSRARRPASPSRRSAASASARGVARRDDQAGVARPGRALRPRRPPRSSRSRAVPGASPRCRRGPRAPGSAASGSTERASARTPRRRPAAPDARSAPSSRAPGVAAARAGQRAVADQHQRGVRADHAATRRCRTSIALLGDQPADVQRQRAPSRARTGPGTRRSPRRRPCAPNSSASTDCGATNTSSSRPRIPATNRRTCSP